MSSRFRINFHLLFEPIHEIMALIALRKLNLQTRMRSNPLELHVWFFVRPFVYFHTLCVRTAKLWQNCASGSGETVQMRSLAWAFVVRLCDKYHNLTSWLVCFHAWHYYTECDTDVA